MTFLDSFTSHSWAYGINNAEQVAGYFETGGLAGRRAVIYSGGVRADLGSLGGTHSIAQGINDAGKVVGYSETTGSFSNQVFHAFLHSGGVMADLGTLGGTNSFANGINNAGQVVGNSATATASSHAFLYSGSGMLDLGTLGGTSSDAKGINSSGFVVGSSDTAGNAASHAFLYDGNAMTDLNAFIPSGSTFSRLDAANAMNDVGQIAGNGTVSGVTHAFLLTPNAFHLAASSGSAAISTDGFAPNAFQPIFIDPDTARSIINLSAGSLSIASLTVGAKVSGTAELKLSNEVATSVANAISIQSRGALTLEKGTLTGASLANAGTLNQAGASQLTVAGSFTNTGTATLGGTTSVGAITNQAILALDGTVAATGGVLNDYGAQITARGTINLSAGATFCE